MSEEYFKVFHEDPGIAYHLVSKLPPPKEFYRIRYDHPGYLKKIRGIKSIDLPKPDKTLFKYDLPSTLEYRESVRDYIDKPIELKVLSTLLYYTAGLKRVEWGYPIRMFPSAGALNSPDIYVAVDRVKGLDEGIYYYNPFKHRLMLIREGSFNRELYKASLYQDHVLNAPLNILLVGVYKRTASKYGARSYRYVLLDVGHLGMNIYLVATSLGLGTVCVGAFEDSPIESLLDLDRHEFILAIYPVGYRR